MHVSSYVTHVTHVTYVTIEAARRPVEKVEQHVAHAVVVRRGDVVLRPGEGHDEARLQPLLQHRLVGVASDDLLAPAVGLPADLRGARALEVAEGGRTEKLIEGADQVERGHVQLPAKPAEVRRRQAVVRRGRVWTAWPKERGGGGRAVCSCK